MNISKGDENGVVNVLEPHPTMPVLATSGIVLLAYLVPYIYLQKVKISKIHPNPTRF